MSQLSMTARWSFFILKPDVVQRRLIGQVLGRLEAAEFEIGELQMLVATEEAVRKHYLEHAGRGYFEQLVSSLAGKRVVAGVAKRHDAVALLRALAGPYEPRIPGTIRGDFAIDCTRNSIHTSDSMYSARREYDLWLAECRDYSG